MAGWAGRRAGGAGAGGPRCRRAGGQPRHARRPHLVGPRAADCHAGRPPGVLPPRFLLSRPLATLMLFCLVLLPQGWERVGEVAVHFSDVLVDRTQHLFEHEK